MTYCNGVKENTDKVQAIQGQESPGEKEERKARL